MPTPEQFEDGPSRLVDISRDLRLIARHDPEAPADFTEDLMTFAPPEGQEATRAFVQQLGQAVVGATFTDQSSLQLAHTAWLVLSARELSQRQIDATRDDLGEQLASVGVESQRVEMVTTAAMNAQKAVSSRVRNWYEVF
jgi:hypothetical protein